MSMAAVTIKLPSPGRVQYTLELPPNAELIVTCVEGVELCGGRDTRQRYRVFTRTRSIGRRSTPPENNDR